MNISEKMDIFKIEKKEIKQFLDKLRQKHTVFGPVESDGITSFKEVTINYPLSTINSHNTDKPPKDIFFPQSEVILRYEGDKIEPAVYQDKPIAIFGVRPCDAKSFLLLDKVFETEKYKDSYWLERRNNCLIFSLACNNPLPTCFCNWLDGGPFSKEGSDIFLVDISDAFLVEPCSKKGEKFITTLSLSKATKGDLKKAENIKAKAESLLSKPVDLASLKDKLDGLWDDPLWDEISFKCLGCAACSYLCPTCHCFDIQDEGKGGQGKRIRIWDSCMFKLFTQEAAGTNPRPTSKERLRQRVMHKFNYFVENLGEFGCVGCGRCIRSCPVSMDVRETINTIKNVKIG